MGIRPQENTSGELPRLARQLSIAMCFLGAGVALYLGFILGKVFYQPDNVHPPHHPSGTSISYYPDVDPSCLGQHDAVECAVRSVADTMNSLGVSDPNMGGQGPDLPITNVDEAVRLAKVFLERPGAELTAETEIGFTVDQREIVVLRVRQGDRVIVDQWLYP